MSTPLSRLALALLFAAGCVGTVDDAAAPSPPGQTGASPGAPTSGEAPGSPTSPAPSPPVTSAPPTVSSTCRDGVPRPGPSPLRRLNRYEYDNTIRDLLGDDSRPASIFPAEERIGGFDNNAESLRVGTLLADQLIVAAERIAERALPKLPTLLPCDPAKTGEDACAAAFVDVFGKRAYRRPLSTTERQRLLGVYQAAKAGGDPFATRVGLVLQAMLLSPNFLYRLEHGQGPAAGGAVRVGGWEMASRLSYLLWGSMPDETLFKAADAGQLSTKEQVAAQARRMLDDPRARAVVAHFHAQWLETERIAEIDKDRAVYAAFTPELRGLLHTEAETFLANVAWDGSGDLQTMLTAPYTFMNAKLAQFYKVTGPAGAAFEKVATDGKQRAGFLTQGGLLAVLAKVNQTSPVERGLFVRERLLCQSPPPPPPGLDVTPPDLAPNLTTRERFTQHKENDACRGCHELMDPIGLGFENYDGLGQWRATESGKPVDASGAIVGTDVAGPFVGAVELARKLAASADVRSCQQRQWFRWAFGRKEVDGDRCTLETLQAVLAGKSGPRDLLVGLTQTDAFLFREEVRP